MCVNFCLSHMWCVFHIKMGSSSHKKWRWIHVSVITGFAIETAPTPFYMGSAIIYLVSSIVFVVHGILFKNSNVSFFKYNLSQPTQHSLHPKTHPSISFVIDVVPWCIRISLIQVGMHWIQRFIDLDRIGSKRA